MNTYCYNFRGHKVHSYIAPKHTILSWPRVSGAAEDTDGFGGSIEWKPGCCSWTNWTSGRKADVGRVHPEGHGGNPDHGGGVRLLGAAPVDQAKGSLVGVFLGLLLFFAQDCRKRESYVVQQRLVRVRRPTEPERSNADEAMASLEAKCGLRAFQYFPRPSLQRTKAVEKPCRPLACSRICNHGSSALGSYDASGAELLE